MDPFTALNRTPSLVLLAQGASKNNSNNNQVYIHTRLNVFAVLKFVKKEDSLLTNLTLLIGIIRNKEKSKRDKYFILFTD